MSDGHNHLDPELQGLIRGCPEPERLSDERRQAIWQVMAARLEQTSAPNGSDQSNASPAESSLAKHHWMHSRVLKWAIPVAVAAAIVLVVGVWPGGQTRSGKPQPGRVYAFSEVPSLIRSAHTFHVHGVHRWIIAGKLVDLPIDSWHTASGGYRSIGVSPHENGVDLSDIVCDGQYQLKIDHANKTAFFKRVTPLQTRMVFLCDMQAMLLGNISRGEGLARTGMETIDGRLCEVWQREETWPEDNVVTARSSKYWFDPSTGALVRAERWAKDRESGQFRQCYLLDKIEYNIDPPAGTFDTAPPANYKLINTKETAAFRSSFQLHTGKTLETAVHPGFVLPDGSVVLPWSARELAKDEPQDSLFAGLVVGGELPKLPLEIYGLTPQGATKPTYLGRHLAWTRKDGRCFEWALYVPEKELLAPDTFFSLLTRPNPADRDLKEDAAPEFPPFAIEVTAGDFDELVLGAMAELSDNGTRPESISLESVLQLADSIRQTLPRAAEGEAAPAPTSPK